MYYTLYETYMWKRMAICICRSATIKHKNKAVFRAKVCLQWFYNAAPQGDGGGGGNKA